MKKIKILILLVFVIFVVVIVDYYNLLSVNNFEFPANTYKNALYIPENYINLDDFLNENKDCISMTGLSHEVGFLDIDLGLIEEFAYESDVFKRKYLSWGKDVYVDKEVALECLERAKFVLECREREYTLKENIKKEKYNYIFDVKFENPKYFYEEGQYYFSVMLENFEYTYISADDKSDYLEIDKRELFIENLISYISSDTGVIYSGYKFDYKTDTYIFEIEENTKIKNMVITNPLHDYLIGSQFKRTLRFDFVEVVEQIQINILGKDILKIDETRLDDNDYGLKRLDNRWALEEIDTIFDTIRGDWDVKEYAGFIIPDFYCPNIWGIENKRLIEPDEEVLKAWEDTKKASELAKKNIPGFWFSTDDEYNKERYNEYSVINEIYVNGRTPSPVSVVLCNEGEDEDFPLFRNETALSTDLNAKYPVVYIKFFVYESDENLEDGGSYRPATLVFPSDNTAYILIDGAFYTIERREE